jgi:hypothetical protein
MAWKTIPFHLYCMVKIISVGTFSAKYTDAVHSCPVKSSLNGVEMLSYETEDERCYRSLLYQQILHSG